ncbi:MAG: MFS transporter [Dehalococcoidia bacterium]
MARQPGPARATAFASAVATAGVLPVFLTGGLAVQIAADLGFSESKLGLAVATYFATSALASAPLGRLAQRIGFASSLRLAAALSAVALAGIALSPTLGVLSLSLVAGGLANSLGQPAANGFIVHAVPERRRAFAFAVKQSAIPFSTLLGGLAVPVLALTVGWRWAFAAAALAAAVLPAARPGDPPPVRTAAPGERLLRLAPLLVLGGAAAFAAAAANSLGAFVTASAVDAGFGEAAAGWIQAAGSITGLSVRLLVGWLTDRGSVRDFSLVVAMMAGGVAGFAFLGTGSLLLFALGVAIGYGLGWAWPGLFNYAVAQRHLAAPAAATGITQSGVYIGGASGPLVFGLVAEHESYALGWGLTAISAAIAAAGVHIGRQLLDRRG